MSSSRPRTAAAPRQPAPARAERLPRLGFELRRRHLLDLLLVAVLLACIPWLSRQAYSVQHETQLPIDALPVLLPISGFHELEPLPNEAGYFRWTAGSGILELPNPGGRLKLRLTMASGTADKTPLLLQAGNNAQSFLVGPGLRRYTLLLPPQPGERVALRLESPTFTANERALGIVVSQAQIAGSGGSVPLAIAPALGIATLGGYLLLRRAGLRALLVGCVILTLLVLATLWQRDTGWRYGLLGPLLTALGGASLFAVLFELVWPPIYPAPPPRIRLTRRDGWALTGLLLLTVAVALPWLGAPDPVGDMENAARRMGFLQRAGLVEAFDWGGDYMPLRLYILYGLGFLVPLLGGSFWEPVPTVTHILIKLPSIIAGLATVALLFVWSRRRRPTAEAALIGGLYAIAPPLWINFAWWGQVDALLILPMVAAVVLFDRAGGRWSWVCWALALLIKPQAIILAPLMFVVTLRRHGCRGLAQGGGLAAAILALAATPLVLAGQSDGLYQATAGSVGRFPAATARAYNLWYLVTQGRNVSDLVEFGGLSFRMIGLLLVGGATGIVTLALLRRSDGLLRAAGAAALALAFFCLPTQIHERYAFLSLAFLALCIAANRWFYLPFLVITVNATINILGALRGFWPEARLWIRATPLPDVVSVVNLLVLGGLLVYLLVASWGRRDVARR